VITLAEFASDEEPTWPEDSSLRDWRTLLPRSRNQTEAARNLYELANSDRVTAAERNYIVRRWARAKGYQILVNCNGRIPRGVQEDWKRNGSFPVVYEEWP
jgi:hypothetical protein